MCTPPERNRNAENQIAPGDGCGRNLQVFRPQPCSLCDSGEHPRTKFFIVVESEYEIWPAGAGEGSVTQPTSPFSRRSAITRRARAWTFALASSGVCPYARTPGRSTTSAIQRPSSSCSISTVNVTFPSFYWFCHRLYTFPSRRESRSTQVALFSPCPLTGSSLFSRVSQDTKDPRD